MPFKSILFCICRWRYIRRVCSICRQSVVFGKKSRRTLETSTSTVQSMYHQIWFHRTFWKTAKRHETCDF